MTLPVEGQIGDRQGRLEARDQLRARLNATPTGRNLQSGSDTRYKFDSDPTGTEGSWPDGATGYFVDGATLWLCLYDRETGWVTVQLS